MFAALPVQHVLPIWPSVFVDASQSNSQKYEYDHGVDEAWRRWFSSSQCVPVPEYIAYGLLDLITPGKDHAKVMGGEEGKGSTRGKNQASPQEQEFHQQILRKLALHLAAQPDELHEAPQADAPQEDTPVPEVAHVDGSPSPHQHETLVSSTAELSNVLPELARASNDFDDDLTPCDNASRCEECETGKEDKSDSITPDVFPATPEEHDMPSWSGAYVGVSQPTTIAEKCAHEVDKTWACWPSSSQLVCVPVHIAYGLLGTMVPGQDYTGNKGGKGVKGSNAGNNPLGQQEQDFHQQMLRKLALHLAAQPESLHVPAEAQAPQQKALPQQTLSLGLLHRLQGPEAHGALSEPVRDSNAVGQVETHFDVGTWGNQVRNGRQGMGAGHIFSPMRTSPQQHEFHQQMLQKLALHLAAQPHPPHESTQSEVGWHPAGTSSCSGLVEQFKDVSLEPGSDPMAVGEDKTQCDRLIADLDPSLDTSRAERAAKAMAWILPAARPLSLTRSGSRLVQKAIDVAPALEREKLAELLLQDPMELCTSPHANHVITKLIEVMPPIHLVAIGEAMRGKAAAVARNQFGSRIMERLFEHSAEDQIGFLLDELLEDLEALARHQFGNFVVQRLFEHATVARKHACAQKLRPHILQHATHKTACNVVQRLLEHSDLAWQAAIADDFLAGEGETSLEAIAATRYGSYVVQRLVDRLHPRIDAVKARVKAAHPQLQGSSFSQKKIVDFLGKDFFS